MPIMIIIIPLEIVFVEAHCKNNNDDDNKDIIPQRVIKSQCTMCIVLHMLNACHRKTTKLKLLPFNSMCNLIIISFYKSGERVKEAAGAKKNFSIFNEK